VAREHIVKVVFNDTELEELDELRGNIPRPTFLRSLVHRPPDVAEVASRDEALAILTAMARDGRVTPAIALARELRSDEAPSVGDGSLLDRLLHDGS
jgi:hypothetical protein